MELAHYCLTRLIREFVGLTNLQQRLASGTLANEGIAEGCLSLAVDGHWRRSDYSIDAAFTGLPRFFFAS